MTKKKIALLIGQGDASYQRTLIGGVSKELFAAGYELHIFTNFHTTDLHTDVEPSNILGETKIFDIVPWNDFMGILIVPSTLQYSGGLRDSLQEQIAKEYNGPVISLDYESKFFDAVMLDDAIAMQQMVEHLSRVHGYTDIAFLSGPLWHAHAVRRLEGYKNGLSACDIPYDETKVYEGNFWYGGGQRVALEMIRKGQLPEVLMCANQAMAIGAYRIFMENGIRIPEDIAITGFDALDDGVAENYRITSMIRDGEATGRRAAQALMGKIENRPPREIKERRSSFLIWDSCGCPENNFTKLPGYTQDMMRPVNAGRYENFFSNYNYMLEDLLHCENLEDLPGIIHSTFRYLDGFSIISLCLDKKWLTKKDGDETLSSVYCFMERFPGLDAQIFKKGDKNFLSSPFDIVIPEDITIPEVPANISDFSYIPGIPSKQTTSRAPKETILYYYVPLHFHGTSFGYALIGYPDTNMLPDCCSAWIRNICNTLETLRMKYALKNQKEES
ncbi:MAG: substrate-binding domain-containing protein [Clostridiales bacterium]|nr:substrate-binding domain-containing protein [Clostridiales bacterium]